MALWQCALLCEMQRMCVDWGEVLSLLFDRDNNASKHFKLISSCDFNDRAAFLVAHGVREQKRIFTHSPLLLMPKDSTFFCVAINTCGLWNFIRFSFSNENRES